MTQPTQKELKQFAATIAVGIAIIPGLAIPYFLNHNYQTWPWITAAIIITVSLVKTSLLKIPYILWMKLARMLGRVNNWIFLFLVFFLVITPVATIKRICFRSRARSRKRIISSKTTKLTDVF